jgi:hypothetical protein
VSAAGRAQEVCIPVEVASDLVAGHVHHLWNQVVNDDLRGCCKRCCAPCNALSQLLELGLLDDLYEIYHGASGGDSEVWDDQRGEIDRRWFDRAWSQDLGCHVDA